MPITTGFDHIATLTADLDRFKHWYSQVFDVGTVAEMPAEGDHPRMAVIRLGEAGSLNVFEVGRDTIVGEQRRIGGRGAIDHFGIAVADRAALEVVRDRLVEMGADIGEIQTLGETTLSLFFRDVDGMELEVCAPVERAGPAG